jgi:hypothetical protein
VELLDDCRAPVDEDEEEDVRYDPVDDGAGRTTTSIVVDELMGGAVNNAGSSVPAIATPIPASAKIDTTAEMMECVRARANRRVRRDGTANGAPVSLVRTRWYGL